MSVIQPGRLFANRFEIDRLAGSGGMGTVYRARDQYTGDWVALKLLHGGAAGVIDNERFTREAQLLSELRHPNIVSYVAHGQTRDGQRYLVMEWLEGEDLATRLKSGPLTLAECERLFIGIAEGLAVTHQRGIVHRDLKPTNLILPGGQLERVKILDFGVARRTSGSPAMTRTGVVIGTPEYMAPEQARGVRDITPAADIFALGCLLYQCLAGRPPFTGEQLAALLVRILFEEPTPILELCPELPLAVGELIARMLVKDPALRLPDARALRDALSALRSISGSATMPGTGPLGRPFPGGEQGLFSVIVAQQSGAEIDPSATLPLGAELKEQERQRTLHDALAAIGLHAEFLLDGTLIVTITIAGSVMDQAAQAAHAALLIKERWPEAEVALATGRGAVLGQQPVGEVISRAVQLIAGSTRTTSVTQLSGVWVDPLSAQLMARNFQLVASPGGTRLMGEEHVVDESRPLLGKPTPCVGREAELGRLDAELQVCIDEEVPRILLITAPPGSGKSRLRHEFLRRIAQRGQEVLIMVGRGELMTAGTPYRILGQTLRRLCGLSGCEPLAEQRERLRSRLALHIPPLEQQRTLEFLGELAGVVLTDEVRPSLLAARENLKLMHEQIRCAFVDWLHAECAASPVLLVLDDLQWSDAMTVALLDFALRKLDSSRLFVLALARPEVHAVFPRLWHERAMGEIPLKGLSKRASERLIKQVLGSDVPPATAARIVEQASGNALYLEEIIRATAEGKGDDLPETVLAMLQARIGRLLPEPRRMLHAASVFGQYFWMGGLALLLGGDKNAPELASSLQELIDSELIHRHSDSRIANEPEYGFRHVLMRDAAYALITNEARVDAHCVAADYLHNYPEARSHLISALEALDTLAEDNANRRRRVAITLQLMEVSLSSDAPEEYIARLQRAEESARQIPESEQFSEHYKQLALLNYWLGHTHYLLNQTPQAIKYFNYVLSQKNIDEKILVLPLVAIGRLSLFTGNFVKAASMLERAVSAASKNNILVESLHAEACLGLAWTARGRCAEGVALARSAVTQMAELGIPVRTLDAHWPLSNALFLVGDYAAAIEVCTASLIAAREAGARIYIYLLSLQKAWAEVRAGNNKDSIVTLQECLAIREELARQVIAPDWLLTVQVEQALADRSYAAAAQLAEEAAAVAKAQGGLFAGGIAQRLWAQALSEQSQLTAAQLTAATIEQHLEDSETLLMQGGCVLELARTHVAHGEFCLKVQELSSARSYLSVAHNRLLQCGLEKEATRIQLQLQAIQAPVKNRNS